MEIKAAAIDVVAEVASQRGVPVVFADNDVRPLPGQADLDAALESLVGMAAEARARVSERRRSGAAASAARRGCRTRRG